jgi:DNA-binding protein H-NS
MSIDALIDLRAKIAAVVDAKVSAERKILEEKLARLSRYGAPKRGRPPGPAKRGRGALKGSKVAAKYRDPDIGMTWAGRGLRPKWISAALKGGKKLEDFLVVKAAAAKAIVKKSKTTKSKKK